MTKHRELVGPDVMSQELEAVVSCVARTPAEKQLVKSLRRCVWYQDPCKLKYYDHYLRQSQTGCEEGRKRHRFWDAAAEPPFDIRREYPRIEGQRWCTSLRGDGDLELAKLLLSARIDANSHHTAARLGRSACFIFTGENGSCIVKIGLSFIARAKVVEYAGCKNEHFSDVGTLFAVISEHLHYDITAFTEERCRSTHLQNLVRAVGREGRGANTAIEALGYSGAVFAA